MTGGAGQRRYRLSAAPVVLRLSQPERERIEAYADERAIPLTQAVRRLVRSALSGQSPATSGGEPDTPGVEFLTELGMLNLIATEQLIQLVESITPEGPGAAKVYIASAASAAQSRIALGSMPERKR